MILKMNRKFLIIFLFLFIVMQGVFSHATQLPHELTSEFRTAVEKEDLNTVKTLLDKHPELIEVQVGAIGLTPLSWSIVKNNWDMFSFFVFEKKVDLNAKGRTNITDATSLHYAAKKCYPRMAKALIEEGAEVDVDSRGPVISFFQRPFWGPRTALAEAIDKSCLTVAAILLENGADLFVMLLGHDEWPPATAKEYAVKFRENPQMAALLADWEKRRRSLSSHNYRLQLWKFVDTSHFCDTYEELWFGGPGTYYDDQKGRAQLCLNKREEWSSNREIFLECNSLAYSYEEGTHLYNRECRGLKPSEKPELIGSDLRHCRLRYSRNYESCEERTEKTLNMYLQSYDSFPISSVSKDSNISQLFPEPTSFPGKEITWGEIASNVRSITGSALDPFGWFGASVTFNQNLQFRGKYLQNGIEYYSYYENKGCVLFHAKEYAGPYDFPEIEKGDVYGISRFIIFESGKTEINLINTFYELKNLRIECEAGALPSTAITSDSTIFEFLKILRGIITIKLHLSP